MRRIDPEKIELTFRHMAIRKVAKDGTFRFDGRIYEVEPVLSGQKIDLRYNPDDSTDIVVYLGNDRVQKARLFKPPAHLPKKKKKPKTTEKIPGPNSSRQFLDSLVQQKIEQKEKRIAQKSQDEVFTLASLLDILDMPEQRLTREDRQNIRSVFDTFGPFDAARSEKTIKNIVASKGKIRHMSFYLRVLVEAHISKLAI